MNRQDARLVQWLYGELDALAKQRREGCQCRRFSYRTAGPLVWRRCQRCGREEQGRFVRLADPKHQGEGDA